MTTVERERRVAIVFRGGDADAATLAAFKLFGTKSSAEVVGVFVEDVDVFRVAEIPYTREVYRLTSTARNLSTSDLEREVRVQAVRAESALRAIAEEAGVRWSFRTLRARLHSALREAAREVDWLVIGAAQTVVNALPDATHRRREPASGAPIAVLFDGSENSLRAIRAGAELASTSGRKLAVLLAPRADEESEAIKLARDALGSRPVTYRLVTDPTPEGIARAIRALAPALFVLGDDEGGHLARAAPSGCPTLLVRR